MAEEDGNQNSFVNFMSPKNTNEEQNQNKNVSFFKKSKTQDALDEEREKDKEEKAKELIDAKKNSIALANRYGKSDMMKMQAKNIIMMIPFIVVGSIVFLILFFKGGTWLSKGINLLFNKMIGK